MGFLKGALTFSRYRLTGETREEVEGIIDSQIRKYAFTTFSNPTDEKIMGWTGLENILDTDFQNASYAWGPYLLFSLRVDRRMIPPSLLKIRVLEAEKQSLAETGRKRIDRQQREALRESVRLDLLRHAPPIPAFFEICWSVSDRSLLFSSLSDKVIDDFQALFKTTFGDLPCPYVPWDPTFLDPAIAGALALRERSDPPEIDRNVLGREFLTWLWFKSEERNGMISLADGTETEVLFVRRLVLESGDGEYAETVVCQGVHADLKEGREALRQGKKIKEARLKLSRDTATWEFTFKADRFQFQSLKQPVIMDSEMDEEDKSGQVLERIYLLEMVIRIMDQLFMSFLNLRMSGQWLQERTRMHQWLQP
jgi:hypothetical protein